MLAAPRLRRAQLKASASSAPLRLRLPPTSGTGHLADRPSGCALARARTNLDQRSPQWCWVQAEAASEETSTRRRMQQGNIQPRVSVACQTHVGIQYQWWDDDGVRHGIRQAKGCEQGFPFAPAFFALGQHEALRRADSQLRQSESLMVFLDDLYVLLPDPTRARAALDLMTGASNTQLRVCSRRSEGSVIGETPDSHGGVEPLHAPALAALNLHLADMNLDVPVHDARRTPHRSGCRHGMDTSSRLTPHAGVVIAISARRKLRQTYPELLLAEMCWHEAPERSRMPYSRVA